MVLRSDLLGSLQWREEPISWYESYVCGGYARSRGEDGTAKQCCLHKENVSQFYSDCITVPKRSLIHIYTPCCRYDLMKSCWLQDPSKRPTFSSINTLLDKYLEELAGYMHMQSVLFPAIQQKRSSEVGRKIPHRFFKKRSSTVIFDQRKEQVKRELSVTINVTSPRGSVQILSSKDIDN